MTEKSQQSANKNTKNKKKRKKRRSHSKDQSSRESYIKKTPNCEEKIKDEFDVRKMKVDRKHGTSSESIHDSGEYTLQQPYYERPPVGNFQRIMSTQLNETIDHCNSEAIPQLESEFCSSLDDVISTTNYTTGKWQLSQDTRFSGGNQETLRWQNCCDNPMEELQRIEKYKADRRQRYYDQARNKTTTSRYYAEI